MQDSYIYKELYGYNNAVKILNDIGKTCYSNSELGAVGRSFNFEDIEEKLITKPTYTERQTYAQAFYPVIHMYEEYSTETYNGATNGYRRAVTSIAPIHTIKSLGVSTSSFSNSNYYYMTMKSGNSDTNLGAHWLASRCVDFSKTYALFGVQCVLNGDVGYQYLFLSGNAAGPSNIAYAVRPVVEIPLDTIILGGTGGTIENPISIQKR